MNGRENLQWLVKQVLDVGAFGIVFPYVEAMAKVLGCKSRGIPCDLRTGASDVEQYLEEGYSFVTVGYWNDAGISGGVAKALEVAREASGRTTD